MDAPAQPLLVVADRVRTLDAAAPSARAVLVDRDRIVWVGDDPQEAPEPPSRRPALRVDLDGAWLQPAFVDAHVHLTFVGLTLTGLDLSVCRSAADCVAAVQAVAGVTAGRVVMGSGWDDFGWPEGGPPDADELGAAADGRPVFLVRADGHSSLIDRRSLDAAPLERIDGVERDAAGRPTGLLKREAHQVALRWFIAELPASQVAEARRAVVDHALSLGIASVHEMGGPDGMGEDDFEVWRTSPGALEVRCYWGGTDLDFVAARGLRCVGGALHLDGTVGSRTAALGEPYADGPGRGRLYRDTHDLVDFASEAARRGIQVAFHCIGDRAVAQAVAVLEAAAQDVGLAAVRRTRPRLEHCALVPPSLPARIARLGAVASVRPGHDRRWGGEGGLYAHRLGARRAARTNPLRPLADAGVPLAFGSDAATAPLDPWASVDAAVGHHQPEHRLAEEVAVASAVAGGRHAARQDGVGRVRRGQRADLAAFAGADRRCLLTIVRGRVVHGEVGG